MELINKSSAIVAKKEKFRFNLFNLGIILLIILSQYNIAKWGASFSYIALPAILFLIGAIFTKFQIDKDSLLIFLLFAAFFVSTAVSNYVEFGREMFSFFFFCVFFVLAVSHQYTLKELRVFIIVYIIVSITASLNICFNWVTGNFIQAWTKRSSFVLFGVTKDPNYSFAYLSPSFVLSFLIIFFTRKKSIRFLCIFNCLVTLVALLFASSRAGMLAIIISMFVIPLFCTQLKKKTRLLIFVTAVLVIAIGYFAIALIYNDYALSRMFEDKDGAGRLVIWNYAITVFKSNPIIGGGFNAGSSVSMFYEGHATHSIFLDILCDSGVIGLFFFLIFYYKNCFWPNWDNFEFMFILSVSVLVPLMFINGFNTTTFYFPLIMLSLFNRQLRVHDYSVILKM